MEGRPIQLQKWNLVLLVLGALAIAVHFILVMVAPYFASWPLLLVLGLGAIPFLWQIGAKLVHKDFGADVLAAISIVAAVLLGQYLAAVLVMLMLSSGQALESYALRRASSVLQALADRMPRQARRKEGDSVLEIDISDIRIGDIIQILPHETSPVDGTVISGHSFMDESYLTGEPYQVAKAPGAVVISGSINGESLLLIKAEKLAKDSRYSNIMSAVERARENRPKIRRLADRLGSIFAPVSLLVAIAVWIYTGDPVRFLSVLVVATPCPLFIAIPVAIISAISLAARLGIIINDPAVLELLPTCTTAIFDKTGTLTYGKPSLTEVIALPGFLESQVLSLAASLEQYSKHPLAKAVVEGAAREHVAILEAEKLHEKPGLGLFGTIGGDEVFITGRAQLAAQNLSVESLPKDAGGLECFVVINNRVAGCLKFRDEPRGDSRNFVRHLTPFHNFTHVILLSGDRKSEVDNLANRLGLSDARAEQSPEQKLATVLEYGKKSPTLFMGDGINDAPALKAATVGIAFGQPSTATKAAAGAVILESSLSKVDELLHLSNAFRRVALTSAIGGMALSFVAMFFAAGGYITPAAGALLQQVIDAIAIVNALRLTFKTKIQIDLPS